MEAFISQTQVTYEVPSEIIYEKKLDTALRDTFLASFESRYAEGKLNCHDRVMLEHVPKFMLGEQWDKGPTYMGFLFRDIFKLNNNSVISSENRKQHSVLMEALLQVVEIQLLNMMKNYEASNKKIVIDKIRNHLSALDIPKEIRSLIHVSSWLTQVIDKGARMRRRQGKMSAEDYHKFLLQNSRFYHEGLDLTVVYGDRINVIILKNKIWIMPYAGLVMMQNKVADCISVLLFAYFNSGVSLPVTAYSMTLSFIRELSYLMILYKGKFFGIVKGLESLCIAESIAIHENWNNKEFLKVTSDAIYEDTGFDYMMSPMRTLIMEASTPMRHQLCCLGKLTGHPYVDMKSGAKNLYDKTTESYQLNLSVVNDCINHIKINYIRNHVLRHKKWPPCEISYGGSAALTQCFVRNKDPHDSYITKHYGPVNLDDMNFVTILENERFYKLNNVIPYLKDKTISLLRSKVLKTILSPEDADRPKWEETRLLLAYLLNPSFVHNHVDYIERYESSHDLEELLDYLVIRVVPKEKELKTDFRGFGCKTYEDRFRALAQEKNAMRYLDDYSDEQAMTLSELEILRRLSTFRHLSKAYPGHKILYVNVDAKSWNHHFREETVDAPMKETLDKIFGTSIFGKTHLAYQQTLFYVPGFPDTYYWKGQAGGIEGLNQDTWVVVYLGQIKTALEGLGFKYHCLCKGDDLRIALAVPPHVWKNREMSDIKNDIIKRLANTMKSFGHEIKVLESYGSSKYFSFSKNSSIGEVELPQGFRKIQKCYGASNAMIATLDEYIGSTFSNAHSTCKVEPNVLPSYLVGLYWSLTYLITHPTYEHLNANQLTSLMLTPSLAGGFPIIYLHNMAIRAESDLLSPFIELYSFCVKFYPHVATYMSNMMHAPIRSKDERPIMLYKDPYAIPHDRPKLPSAVLREFIVPILKKYAKQEDVVELINASSSQEMEGIHEALNSASVFNAKILSALYSSTPEGILQELVRKFESARSINELMVRSVGPHKSLQNLRKVIRSERRLQIWRVKRLEGKNVSQVYSYCHLIRPCPTESAYNIRKTLWGREITGITMPPLQHQVVMLNAFSITDNTWVNENHFTYTISSRVDNVDDNATDHYSSGPFRPFLGYSTRNGMTEPTVHFIEKDPMLVKIKNLLDLITWTNVSKSSETGEVISSNCPDLIRVIIGSYTNVDLSELAPFSGIRRSGTIQHHVRAPAFRESIVPNVLSNVYTRVMGESNTHIRYRNSRHHYYVNFLHIYSYSIWMSMVELEVSPTISTPEKIWTVSAPCDFCNRIIEEEPIVFDLKHVKGVRLHPLAISKVGQVAEAILRTSLDASKDIKYNIDTRVGEEMPIEVAYQGILQEVMEQTYMSRVSLETRYDTPTLGDDAYQVLVNLIPQNRSREVGQSEIKRIPIYDLAMYVSLIVMHFSGKIKRTRISDTRDGALSTMQGESLPWFGLVNQIHKAGRLPKLILHFAQFLGTPHATCFYNPVTACRFICRYANMLIRYLNADRPIVVLSYYTISHLNYIIELYLTEKIHCALRKDIGKFMPASGVSSRLRNQSQKDDLIALMKECLVLLACLYNLDYIADEISNLISEHKYRDLHGFGLELLEITMIDDFISETGKYTFEIVDWLDRWKALGLDIAAFSEEEDWQDVLHSMTLRYASIKTQVHYTNVGHCCLTLRASSISEGEDSSSPTLLPFQQIPSDPDMITLIEMDRPCLVFPGLDYTAPVFRTESDPCYIPNEMTSVRMNECFATEGSSTGSETHLLYILYGQGMTHTPRSQGCQATCLADGYGGFTSVIGYMHRGSSIIYHTMPEDLESSVIATTPIKDEMIGHVLTSHLDEGYTDLRIWSTFERLKMYGQVNDYVTSDLELGEDSLQYHMIVNLNIIQYYLQTRTRDCWIIIKLDMRRTSDVSLLMDIIMHHCLYCCIHSPRSNDSSKYVYLVGRGWRKSYDKESFEAMSNNFASNQSVTRMNRYVKQVKGIWRRYYNGLIEGLDISKIDPGFRRHPSFLAGDFQDRIMSLLMAEFDFPLVLLPLEHIENSVAWRKRILNILESEEEDKLALIDKSLGTNTTHYQKSLSRELSHGDQRDLAIHRHVIICKRFKMAGYRAIISCYGGKDAPSLVDRTHVQQKFLDIFNRLTLRDRHNVSGDIVYHMDDWEHEGIIVRYPSSYRRGITIGLVLLGTLGFADQLVSRRERIEQRSLMIG